MKLMTMKDDLSRTYLSTGSLAGAVMKKNFFTVCGSVLTVFFGLGVAMSIAGYSEELRKNLMVYVLFLIPSVLLIYKGIKLRRLIELAKRYNSIFECDRDGVVTISELAKQTGKPSGVILSEIELLLKKGYLCRCTLQKKGNPCVILADGIADNDGAAFVNAVCPVCGGTTRMRAGSSGKCEYCGSAIDA